MKIEASTAQEYYQAIPTDRREQLMAVRSMVKRVWPGIREDLSYGMPTFHLDGHALCALGNQKNFMALYVMPHDLLDAFKKDLKVHDHGRSCIRFRRLTEEVMDLFERIIKFTGSTYTDSRLHGRSKSGGKGERQPVSR